MKLSYEKRIVYKLEMEQEELNELYYLLLNQKKLPKNITRLLAALKTFRQNDDPAIKDLDE